MTRTLAPLLLVSAFLGAAGSAGAVDLHRTVDVPAPPAKVWQTIGDFCGIGAWHPAIEGCKVADREGRPVRTLSLKGGGTILEEQASRDDKVMAYTYTALESPLPVSDYRATLAVVPDGAGSKVTWTGSFTAKGVPDEAASEAVQGHFDHGLRSIADRAR